MKGGYGRTGKSVGLECMKQNSQGINKRNVKNFKNKSILHFPLLPAYTNLSVQFFISSPVYLLFCTKDRAQVFVNGKQKLLHTEVSKRKLAFRRVTLRC